MLEDRDFIAENTVEIEGDRFMHAKKVIHAKQGSVLACGRINGKMGTGQVTRMGRRSFRLNVTLTQDPPAPLPLILILALPRPKMLKRILQAVSSMGIKTIYLINSWRVEKSFWQSDLLDPEKLNRHLKLGLAQARDTQMPVIHLKKYFTAFVNQELPHISDDKLRLLAHPKSLVPCPSGIDTKAVLVIGPEGGFIDLEVETLEAQGFQPCTMGPRILRVETAVPALIARLYT